MMVDCLDHFTAQIVVEQLAQAAARDMDEKKQGRPKQGRPTLGDTARNLVKGFRVSRASLSLIVEAAMLTHKTESRFIADAATKEAARVLKAGR